MSVVGDSQSGDCQLSYFRDKGRNIVTLKGHCALKRGIFLVAIWIPPVFSIQVGKFSIHPVKVPMKNNKYLSNFLGGILVKSICQTSPGQVSPFCMGVSNGSGLVFMLGLFCRKWDRIG